jgi:hypothetical protein
MLFIELTIVKHLYDIISSVLVKSVNPELVKLFLIHLFMEN